MRRSRTASAAVLSTALWFSAGCTDSSSPDASETPTPLPSTSGQIGPSPGESPGATVEPPGPVPSVAGTPTPSETIRVAGDTLVTHVYIPIGCGIEWMEFEGSWWRARDPVKNPPEGWTEPTQDGDVRLISKDHLRYEPYGLTDTIDFYRTKKSPPPCDD